MEDLDHVVGALHEGVMYMFLHQNAAHRNDSVGQSFGRSNNIRCYAESFRSRAATNTTKRGDDFIENQQYAMPVTNLAQLLKIANGWRQDSGGAGYGLNDDRGNIAAVVQGAKSFEIVGEMSAPCRLASFEGVVLEVVSMTDVIHTGD